MPKEWTGVYLETSPKFMSPLFPWCTNNIPVASNLRFSFQRFSGSKSKRRKSTVLTLMPGRPEGPCLPPSPCKMYTAGSKQVQKQTAVSQKKVLSCTEAVSDLALNLIRQNWPRIDNRINVVNSGVVFSFGSFLATTLISDIKLEGFFYRNSILSSMWNTQYLMKSAILAGFLYNNLGW